MSWLLAAAAAPSVIKGISGIADIFGGKARARRNIRPEAQVNANIQKNATLAEQMGRQGLPQEQYNLSRQNIQRNQSGVLGALSRSANPNAGLQSLLRASNDASLGLDVQNANTRLNNQRFAFGQRSALANEQQRVWDWNRKGRYLEEANAASQQIGAGKQNAMGALDNLSALGGMALGASSGGGGSSGGFNALPNATVTQPQGYQPRLFQNVPQMQQNNYQRYNGGSRFNGFGGY